MSDANRLFGTTFATTDAAVATPNSVSTYNVATAVTYCIDGKAYEKATVSGGTTPTADPLSNTFNTLAVNKGCALVWTLTSGGTVGLWQSDVKDLDESGNFIVAPEFPSFDMDTYCPIGYTVLKNGSTGSTFTVGSSNWNATGMTATTVSVLTMPRRPQES